MMGPMMQRLLAFSLILLVETSFKPFLFFFNGCLPGNHSLGSRPAVGPPSDPLDLLVSALLRQDSELWDERRRII
jgi:hypothetical protein